MKMTFVTAALLALGACANQGEHIQGSSDLQGSKGNGAPVKPLVFCDGGEETQVVIKSLSDDTLRASVTIQSVGDSYPTFHYKVTEAAPPATGAFVGGTTSFSGGAFSLVIDTQKKKSDGSFPSKLSVTDLKIKQSIDCVINQVHTN